MIVGSIVEYFTSLFGELILHVRWWDYSNEFFNINGRICLLYSVYWGLVAVFLMKILNPIIDKGIEKVEKKFNLKTLKQIIILMTIFLFIDCVDSAFAISYFLSKTVVEYNVDVEEKEAFYNYYEYINNKNIQKKYAQIFWTPRKMIKTYPNLRLSGKDGNIVYMCKYYPDIQPYYYKFKKIIH